MLSEIVPCRPVSVEFFKGFGEVGGSPMAKPSEQPGFFKIDFVRFFPHKFWISNWGNDATYPGGFRYKLLSVRDEKKHAAELVLLLEQNGGGKQEMHRVQVKLDALDGYARVFWEGLENEHDIEFEEQDFSEVRTADEFDQAVAEYGWSGDDPDA